MQQIAYLKSGIRNNYYNTTLLKKLEEKGIKYTLQSTKYGKRVLVEDNDLLAGSKVVLSIPFQKNMK